MAIDLSALASGLEGLQRNVKRLEESDRSQKLLELEIARSAPMGYAARRRPGLFGSEVSLEHVGMQDPRIQLQLRQSQEQAAQNLAAEVRAFQTLNPLQAGAAKDLATFRAGIEQQAAERSAALEALASAVAKAPSAETLAALPQDPAVQAAAFSEARQAFARAAVVAPDLARKWAAMLPEPVRAGLLPPTPGSPAGTPGQAEGVTPAGVPQVGAPAPEAPRSGGVSTGGRGFEGRTSRAPAIPAGPAATSAGAPSPAAPSRPLSEGGLSEFIAGRLAAGVPEPDVRTEAIRRLEAENAPWRAVAMLSGQGRALAEARGVLSTAEVTNQVDREIALRSEQKQRALAETQAGVQGEILGEKAGQEVTLPKIARATRPPEQGVHSDLDPFYLAPVEDAKPGEPDVNTVANRDAQQAALTGDAPQIARIRAAARESGADEAQLRASLGNNSWGSLAAGRLAQFKAAPDRSGAVAMLRAADARLEDDGIRLWAKEIPRKGERAVVEALQSPGAGTATGGLSTLFGKALVTVGGEFLAEDSLTPRGLAEHLWLGSVAPGSGFKRIPSLAVVQLPAKLPADVQRAVQLQNQAAMPEFRAVGAKIPQGNVLLLDLAAYRGERR